MYAIVNSSGNLITGTICTTLIGARRARTRITRTRIGTVNIVRLITKPLLATELAEVMA